MVELLSIHDRMDFTSTKATAVTYMPEVISRAGGSCGRSYSYAF